MFNQNRIYRVFQLINNLKSQPPKGPKVLADLLGISERSVYRYLDLLQQLGFEIGKTETGRFYLESNSNEPIPFSEQELTFLTTLIQSVGKKNRLAQSVLHKIGHHTEQHFAAQTLYNTHLGYIIEQLSVAIQERKQVLLIKYYSARSETIADRLVEPMQFTENYEALSAFEVSSQQNKYFNIGRISKVKILSSDMQFEQEHQFFKPDVFGFQGKEMDKEVAFEMSLRASLILKEEYPMSRGFLKPLPESNRWIFRAKVQAYEGPARFVMGFQRDIKVVGSGEFLEFLKETYG